MTQTESHETEANMAPAALARALVQCLFAQNLDEAEKYWADDVYEDFVALRPYQGKAAARGFFEGLFAAFPDFHLELETCIGDDTIAFIAWRATGTFTGAPFEGVSANGRSIVVRGTDRMEFSGGKLVRNTIYYDGADFMRQLGLLPPAESAAERGMKTAFNAVTAVKKRVLG